jgi:NADH-ubiquinone oxidoreductase chain 1
MESELVSGFMTEHSSVIFVFFFLAEYASIVLICILSSILFLGGYIELFSLDTVVNTLFFFNFINVNDYISYWTETKYISNTYWDGLIASLSLGIKTCMLIFIFIWARASYPRIRFDQLMSYCWTILLPILIAFIIFIPCLVHSLALIPTNFNLL